MNDQGPILTPRARWRRRPANARTARANVNVITARPKIETIVALQDEARRAGVPLGRYVADLLDRHAGGTP